MTNACYLVGENDGLIGPLLGSWQDAEDACVAMGPNTHLASIHTAEENAFLVGLSMTGSLLGPLMIGYSRTSTFIPPMVDPFTWSDMGQIPMIIRTS